MLSKWERKGGEEKRAQHHKVSKVLLHMREEGVSYHIIHDKRGDVCDGEVCVLWARKRCRRGDRCDYGGRCNKVNVSSLSPSPGQR